MRNVVVVALLVVFVAGCDNGSNGGGGKHGKGSGPFGSDLLELFSWLPDGNDLLRQSQRTVVRDLVGELVDFSAKGLQDGRVPAPGQDIRFSSIAVSHMSELDLQLFASRFGFASGATMYSGSQTKQPGEYVFVSVEHVDATPLFRQPQLALASDRRVQYAAVFERDNRSDNNWPGISPFDCDLFITTDGWYQVSKGPGEEPQLSRQVIDGTQINDVPTAACAIAYGNAIVWMIPKSEFPGRFLLPAYRVTAFESADDFGQTTGDFNIDDSPPRQEPLAYAGSGVAARNTSQVELEVRFVATELDVTMDLGIDLDFLGSLEVDDMTPGETAVRNDTPGDRLVRTSVFGGLKNSYNYVPFGADPGSFFPLVFSLLQPPGSIAAYARIPGDAGIPFVAPDRALVPNDLGIDFAVPNVLVSDPTRGDVYGSVLDRVQYDILLESLSQNADAKLVSAPRIVTLNGQTAAIQSLNYQTPVTNLLPIVGDLFRNRDPTVEFAETGLQLQVTPRIVNDDFIRLDLRPAEAAAIRVSRDIRADNQDFGVQLPSIVTKDIKTSVVVESGQTIVLGGLMRSGQTTIEQGVPWLNRIPVIDQLFASGRDYDTNDRLLLFVTPHIIIQQE